MNSRGRTLTRRGQRRQRIPSRGRNMEKKAAAARAAEEKADKIRRRHEKNRSPTRKERRSINLGLFGPSKKWQEQQMASYVQAAIDEAAPAIEEQAVQMYINQQARAEAATRQKAIINSVQRQEAQEAQRLGRERIIYGDDPRSTKRFLLRPGERELHQQFQALPLEERQDFLEEVLAPKNLTDHQLNAINVRGFGLDPTYEGGKRKKRRKSRKRRVKKKTKSKKRKSKKRRRKRRKTRRKK